MKWGKKSPEEVALLLRPDIPPEYSPTDIAAIQACWAGNASAFQQRRALDWIILQAAQTSGQSYRVGQPDGTAFLEGRRFVGRQIIKLTQLQATDTNTTEELKHGRCRPED